jgi:23S rRNA (guanine2445-N2)-methyltransferase / 23S rRNA (guanine2069-N7)-methyltransferase
LYEGVKAIPWEEHLRCDGSIAVDAHGTNEAFRNTNFVGMRVKDAVCDRFRELYGQRPSVDAKHPDIRINVNVHAKKATIAIDLSGESLHKRGYRLTQVKEPGGGAPLKEALAAAVLLFAGWPKIANEGGALIDPLCGTGTFGIEAAMIASDTAPALIRQYWGFDNWLMHDALAWDDLLSEADDRADAGRASMPPIILSDASKAAIVAANDNIRRAGFAGAIFTQVSNLAQVEFELPTQYENGLIVCNPPYGERLSTASQLPPLYAALAKLRRTSLSKCSMTLITSDASIDSFIGSVPVEKVDLYNGPIAITARTYAPASGNEQEEAGTLIELPSGTQVRVAEAGSEQFAARFAKMWKDRSKKARKAGINVFRVYDADLPDYCAAIDCYIDTEGTKRLHIAEYAAPAKIDPAKTQRRLSDILVLAPAIADVMPENVFLKVRKHSKGGSQYENDAKNRELGIVQENGLSFEVNYSDRLDTGLFPDGRDVRAYIREHAAGKTFLNLFAYTGTASVAAAVGGATQTVTVDISNTYLDWAKKNFELNAMEAEYAEFDPKAPEVHIQKQPMRPGAKPKNQERKGNMLVRADVLLWIQKKRHTSERYDFIYVDPPTFSSSSKMAKDSFDIVRDHAEMLIAVSRLLTADGEAIFCCNKRNFKPDIETLEKAGVELEDISASMLPFDFKRNANIRSTYRIKRKLR